MKVVQKALLTGLLWLSLNGLRPMGHMPKRQQRRPLRIPFHD